jgi:hypothetical protein
LNPEPGTDQLRYKVSFSIKLAVFSASGSAEHPHESKQHTYKAEVNGGWEWFVTPIIGVCQIELIAVTNRSHNKKPVRSFYRIVRIHLFDAYSPPCIVEINKYEQQLVVTGNGPAEKFSDTVKLYCNPV